MSRRVTSAARNQARAVFLAHEGILSASRAIRLGIHPRTLYALRDSRHVEALSRGLYRWAELPPLQHPDLAAVSMRVPKGVLCLISALAYHEITTEVPHEVYVAVARGAEPPKVEFPPIRVFHFSGESFTEGVERHDVDGIALRVYSPEKTLADCFRFRNRIGLDTFLQALSLYRARRPLRVAELMRFARIDRVERGIRPYLEAGL